MDLTVQFQICAVVEKMEQLVSNLVRMQTGAMPGADIEQRAGHLVSAGTIPLSNLAIFVKVGAGLVGAFLALSAFRTRTSKWEAKL